MMMFCVDKVKFNKVVLTVSILVFRRFTFLKSCKQFESSEEYCAKIPS